jgi:hypothetical protein
MTQAQAIERGFTHFLEVWRGKTEKEGVNYDKSKVKKINDLDENLAFTTRLNNLYTVAIFLIKPKPTH